MLLREIEARITKLEELFALADAQVAMSVAELLGQRGASRRQQRKVLTGIQARLEDSLRQAHPQVAAVVRLAYVRAAREHIGANFRMSPEQETKTKALAVDAMRRLHSGAESIYFTGAQKIRQHLVGSWSEGKITPTLVSFPLSFKDERGNSWTLPQYAGAVLRTTVQLAIESAHGPVETMPNYANNGHA